MDRNKNAYFCIKDLYVVLPTEGVDRNCLAASLVPVGIGSSSPRRAWIEINSLIEFSFNDGSSSPRRAWIEILQEGDVLKKLVVVLPTEGVDRNIKERKMPMPTGVVLPTEGVDRNTLKANAEELDARRPPHGGRG